MILLCLSTEFGSRVCFPQEALPGYSGRHPPLGFNPGGYDTSGGRDQRRSHQGGAPDEGEEGSGGGGARGRGSDFHLNLIDEFCIKNDGFCIEKDGFVLKMLN